MIKDTVSGWIYGCCLCFDLCRDLVYASIYGDIRGLILLVAVHGFASWPLADDAHFDQISNLARPCLKCHFEGRKIATMTWLGMVQTDSLTPIVQCALHLNKQRRSSIKMN